MGGRGLQPYGEYRLSDRDVDVLALSAEGLTNREIAQRLEITTHTVSGHVANAIERMGARNRLHAVVLAIKADILDI